MVKGTVADGKIGKDIDVLTEFIRVYCHENHEGRERGPVEARGVVGDYLRDGDIMLCEDCRFLLLHAASKRVICPYDPKPSCKKCETHCYGPGYREKIREVMKFSGMYMIRKGKLGLLKKYFF